MEISLSPRPTSNNVQISQIYTRVNNRGKKWYKNWKNYRKRHSLRHRPIAHANAQTNMIGQLTYITVRKVKVSHFFSPRQKERFRARGECVRETELSHASVAVYLSVCSSINR